MKKKALVTLAVIAVVMVALGGFAARQYQQTDSLEAVRQPVFPGLRESLADVKRVTIRAAQDRLILDARSDGAAWVAANKGGYPVRTEKLRQLLQDLADAHFQEAKTSNPDHYHHLGVRGLNHAESEALLVAVEREGQPALELLVGKRATGWNASYARLVSDPQSWVLDREIEVEDETVPWLDQEVIDVDLERVRSVSHLAPDGDRLWIEKQRPEETLFDVADIPEGHELSYEAIPEVVADVIDNLRFEDVVPATDFQWDEAQTYTGEFRTFDGLVVESRALSRDEEQFVALSVRYDSEARWSEPQSESEAGEAATDDMSGDAGEAPGTEAEDAVAAAEEAADEEASTEVAEAPEEEEIEPAASTLRSVEDVQAEAKALQERLSGWVFRIPEYRYKGFTKRTSELVKKIGDADGEDNTQAGDSNGPQG